MRHILMLFVVMSPLFVLSQSAAPHFEKKVIGKSGAYIYLPGEVEAAGLSYSPDSAKVYTIGSILNDYRFDVIFVELSQPTTSENNISPLLESYLDYLKGSLNIENSEGYQKGWMLNSHPTAKGIKDYWKDKDKNEMIITGWADSKYIAVLIITGVPHYPDSSSADVFFKGIRFPGD